MENQTKPLSGKKVIVLGGSAGIGLATAKLSAQEGAEVIIVSSNQQRINKALDSLPQNAKGYAVDLGLEANIKAFFDTIGKFDHLVYTAAENLTLNIIAETEIEKAGKFFNLRFWSAFATVKYASPNINAGGSISLTGGIAGLRPGSGWSVASSICGAMEGFVRAMAVELAPIRVNSVVPGVVRTNLWDSMADADREALYSNTANAMLVKRIGEAEDIALTFNYLMKQQYGTGQNIVVDGGHILV